MRSAIEKPWHFTYDEILGAGLTLLEELEPHDMHQASMQRVGYEAGINVWMHRYCVKALRLPNKNWAVCYIPPNRRLDHSSMYTS